MSGVLGDAGSALLIGDIGDGRVHLHRKAQEYLAGVWARAVDDADRYLTEVDFGEIDEAVPDVEVEPVLGPRSAVAGGRVGRVGWLPRLSSWPKSDQSTSRLSAHQNRRPRASTRPPSSPSFE